MPISLARLAHARRLDGTQRRVELLFHQLLDRVANPQPHCHLDAVGAERRNLFLVAWLLGTVLHRVIPPAPAAKRARSFSCVETAPDDDAISTFPPDSRHYLSAENDAGTAEKLPDFLP